MGERKQESKNGIQRESKIKIKNRVLAVSIRVAELKVQADTGKYMVAITCVGGAILRI